MLCQTVEVIIDIDRLVPLHRCLPLKILDDGSNVLSLLRQLSRPLDSEEDDLLIDRMRGTELCRIERRTDQEAILWYTTDPFLPMVVRQNFCDLVVHRIDEAAKAFFSISKKLDQRVTASD